jgi:hypothetical protein
MRFSIMRLSGRLLTHLCLALVFLCFPDPAAPEPARPGDQEKLFVARPLMPEK